jgi:Fe-S-cluster containining protein
MQLSPRDINRLEKLGYRSSDFTVREEGFKTLTNINGFCYFFDPKSNACRIYRNRPEGCRYYPIIYSIDERSATLDQDVCQRVSSITAEDLKKITPKLVKLARRLIKEREALRRE